MAKLVTFLLCVAMLQGCGTFTAGMVGLHRQYAEPSDGQRAKLRVLYDMFDHIGIYPDKPCLGRNEKNSGRAMSNPRAKRGFNIMASKSVTFEKKLLDMPSPPFELKDNSSYVYSEFYIPAEKDFLVSMFYIFTGGVSGSAGGQFSYSCPTKFFSMYAKESHNYELSLDRSGGFCHYIMTEINPDGTRSQVPTWKPIQDSDVKCPRDDSLSDEAGKAASR